MLLADCTSDLEECLHMAVEQFSKSDLSTTRQIMSLIEQNLDPSDEPTEQTRYLIWNNLWAAHEFPVYSTRTLQSRQFVLLCKEYGILLEPQHFLTDHDHHVTACGYLSKFESLLGLYLETGGDPNYKLDDGYPLLAATFIHVCKYMDTHLTNSDLEDGSSMDEEDTVNPSESADVLDHCDLSDEDSHAFDDSSDFSNHNSLSNMAMILHPKVKVGFGGVTILFGGSSASIF